MFNAVAYLLRLVAWIIPLSVDDVCICCFLFA